MFREVNRRIAHEELVRLLENDGLVCLVSDFCFSNSLRIYVLHLFFLSWVSFSATYFFFFFNEDRKCCLKNWRSVFLSNCRRPM